MEITILIMVRNREHIGREEDVGLTDLWENH